MFSSLSSSTRVSSLNLLKGSPSKLSFYTSSNLSLCVKRMSTSSIEVQQTSIRDTVKPLKSRKTYLVDIYSHILKNSPVVLLVHHNNLLKTDDRNLRSQIKKVGGELTISRARLLKVALRGVEHSDPASKEAQKTFKNNKHEIFPLLNGPTGLIHFSEMNPKAVDGVVKVLEKSKGSLLLLGAMVDKKALSIQEIDTFKTLPTLPEVRSQLVGVLSILGGAGLVQTLEASGKVLYLTMEERRKQLDPESQKDEGSS